MKNIDRQHLRPPVLAMLLETIERENFDGLLTYVAPNPSIFPHQKIVLYSSADAMLYIHICEG